jgi:hypothetical protein
VVNNSSAAVGSLNLTGGDIFGFDGDGVCTYTFAAANGVAGSSYCTTSQTEGFDPGDYQGPTSTFTITDSNGGSVQFSPGVAAGGDTFFSLEESPNASIVVTVGGAPEPASFALFIGGIGLLAIHRYLRRSLAQRL